MSLEFDDYDEIHSEHADSHNILNGRERLYREWGEDTEAHQQGAGDNASHSLKHPEGTPPDGSNLFEPDPASHSQGDLHTGKTRLQGGYNDGWRGDPDAWGGDLFSALHAPSRRVSTVLTTEDLVDPTLDLSGLRQRRAERDRDNGSPERSEGDLVERPGELDIRRHSDQLPLSEQEETTEIPKETLHWFAARWSLQRDDFGRGNFERVMAKKLGVAPDELREQVRISTTEKIQATEQGELFHYHQSSLENLGRVLETDGTLHSLRELEAMYGDAMQLPGWTANPEAVMMTRDRYDDAGHLLRPGISASGLGAISSEIAYVFRPTLMESDGYNAMDIHPTAPRIVLKEHLAAILVKDPESMLSKAQKMLSDAGFNDIPVFSREEWIRDHYLNRNL